MPEACILLISTAEMASPELEPTRLEPRARAQNELKDLRDALGTQYGQMFSCAENYWEQHFAGNDPSDACVRVRISSAQALHAA